MKGIMRKYAVPFDPLGKVHDRIEGMAILKNVNNQPVIKENCFSDVQRLSVERIVLELP